MRYMHVVPLDVEHRFEMAEDLRQLRDAGVLSEVAFSLTLVPEGNPVIDKAAILGKRFATMREALGTDFGLPVGILLQATIGHGYVPESPAPFTKLVDDRGNERYMMCPLDPDFQAYLRSTVEALAQLRPDFMMVDDDFRMNTGRNGCFCHLHRAGFGSDLSAVELVREVEASPELARRYDAWLEQSLVELARLVRRAMDTVDPMMPASFCTCTGDVRYANAIAAALTAPGQRKVVRINNSRYLTDSQRDFALRMYQGATQIAALDADEIWAEPDTYPQNRYSTGARSMHSHLTASLLEGCTGGKFWISRFHAYEPASGAAYRNILKRHGNFYRAVSELKPRWRGMASPLPEKPFFNWNPLRTVEDFRPLAAVLFGRMGLPAHFAKSHSGGIVLTGKEAECFSDRELETFLAGPLLLDGSAAVELCRRGFGSELGVAAKPWNGGRISGELLKHSAINGSAGGNFIVGGADSYGSVNCVLLTPESDEVEVHSELVNQSFAGARDFRPLAPALTTFANSRGGRVAVYAGIMTGALVMDFFFLNESRKTQLIGVLEWLDSLPVYMPGDAEVYLKCGDTDVGRIMALLNLAADEIEEIPLEFPGGVPARVRRLTEQGEWREVPFRQESPTRISIRRELPTMLPEILNAAF